MILTEGAVIERLRRDPSVQLDPEVANAALIYEPHGAQALAAIYRQYLDVSRSSGIRMMAV